MEIDKLYHGDNLPFMQSLPDQSIDFIYIDPPFFTQRTLKSGENSFEDSWDSLDSFISFLNDRFIEAHRLLKDTGVFCLHLDYRTVHYAKVKLDEVFGYKNFINEVIWCYSGGGRSNRRFQSKHDTILIYSKTKNYKFDFESAKKYGKRKLSNNHPEKSTTDENGRPYIDVLRNGKRYRNYLDENKLPEDWWDDINYIQGHSKKRTGYPTQKPIELSNRLITAFTDENDLVADFFCGSGTTLKSAQNLNRRWLGSDSNIDAINISKDRLRTLV